MDLKEQNILFFARTMKLGGTENVILQLCEIFKPLVNNIVVCSCGGVNVEKLEAMNIRHYQIPDIQNKSLVTIFCVAKCIWSIIKKERISVIHTHHRMAAMYASFFSVFYKFVFFASVHGQFFDKKMFTRLAYRNAQVLACGEKVKENLVNYYEIDDKKVKVLRNAVCQDNNPIFVEDVISQVKKRKNKVVAYIGRLSEEKGVLELVESLKYYDENDRIEYVVVGDGALEDKMKQLAVKHNKQHVIHFLGYKEAPQNIIKQVDCVILPSRTEGLPLTPMEAFANRKPVIATAVGGTPEIVVDWHNGILIEPNSPKDIARAVRDLFSDCSKYDSLCDNAYEDYMKYYNIGTFSEKIVNIYKDWVA